MSTKKATTATAGKRRADTAADKKTAAAGPAEPRKREAKAEAKKPPVAAAKEEKKKPANKNGPAKIQCSLMLAEVYDPEKNDPTGWWMSEKLDGVRCYWTGSNLYSRNGNRFYPPAYFTAGFPKDFQLDGELWTKRNDFQKCVSIVKRQDENDEWKGIKFMVFDAPGMKNDTFTDRLAKLEEVIGATKSEHLVLHEHLVCVGREDLVGQMDTVTAAGGEGMMIRDPDSLYEKKRSKLLLKVKKFEDAEATVTGHQRGTGRLTGLMGAIEVREDSGIEFKIGSGFNDAQRAKPPKIGSKVTFKFMGRSTAGVPRFPIYMREYAAI